MNSKRDRKVVLSFTRLSLFLECPRCFYREVVFRNKRPQGFSPSIALGMDKICKEYGDRLRRDEVEEPKALTPLWGEWNVFQDQAQLDVWRNWKQGLRYQIPKENFEVVGALDECLISRADPRLLMPLDFKSRGFPLKPDTHERYALQLDLYKFLLEQAGWKVANYGALVFFRPKYMHEGCGKVEFESTLIQVSLDTARAMRVVESAIKCLKGKIPPRTEKCEYCEWSRPYKRYTRKSNTNEAP